LITPPIALMCWWSTTAVREYDAKLLLAYWLERAPAVDKNATVSSNFVYPTPKVAQISWDPATNTITPDSQLPSWVFTTKLVAKPDQLIKRRGKAGLLCLNKGWEESKQWIQARAGKSQKVSFSLQVLGHLHAVVRFGNLVEKTFFCTSFDRHSSRIDIALP
jgi:succinyl-CoA synthetase beta subunit